MYELSLFTGAGGGILGTHLLGWTPIGYVEWDDYCQRVLAARIADGLIPCAPIFGDVREFVQSGAAREYRGFADVVSAGFPCQPFSTAGKMRGASDERNMWPAARDVIRDVRPDGVVLENVPGLLVAGYASVVIGDLAAMGYVGRTGCVSAENTGAPHRRERWWVVAHCNGDRRNAISEREKGFQGEAFSAAIAPSKQRPDSSRPKVVADTERLRTAQPTRSERDVSHAECERRRQMEQQNGSGAHRSGPAGSSMQSSWRGWPIEPDVGRVAHGVASRVDRLKALGNGQVPRVVAAAWELLK